MSTESKPKTSIELFFPHRRIPTLIPVKATPEGPQAIKLKKDVHKEDLKYLNPFARKVFEDKLVSADLNGKYGSRVPYDAYLPTQQDKVAKLCHFEKP